MAARFYVEESHKHLKNKEFHHSTGSEFIATQQVIEKHIYYDSPMLFNSCVSVSMTLSMYEKNSQKSHKPFTLVHQHQKQSKSFLSI